MTASFNQAILVGNLGADPELRYTQNQTPVCSFNVATTEYYTDEFGQKKEQTDWHRIVVWGRIGENCSKYLAKGSQVMVEGRLKTRSWQDANGAKRYITEIIAKKVRFLSGGFTGRDRDSEEEFVPSASLSDIPF